MYLKAALNNVKLAWVVYQQLFCLSNVEYVNDFIFDTIRKHLWFVPEFIPKYLVGFMSESIRKSWSESVRKRILG